MATTTQQQGHAHLEAAELDELVFHVLEDRAPESVVVLLALPLEALVRRRALSEHPLR